MSRIGWVVGIGALGLAGLSSPSVSRFLAVSSTSAARARPPSATLTADAPALEGFVLTPMAVTGGSSATGMVTLGSAAPAGGVVVTLSSASSKVAAIPKSLTIPAGQSTATFSVETTPVAASKSVRLKVTLQRKSQIATLAVLPRDRSTWYAAPSGEATGEGSVGSPWDLKTALRGGPSGTEVKPGDTVWLRGGRYSGMFTSNLAGTPQAPIVVRQYPGERAILEKNSPDDNVGVLRVKGAYTWYWGFEITNSYPDRNRLDPDGLVDPWRGSGVNVWAPGTRYINMSIHDNGHGLGLWNEEGGTEVYGCVLYSNGNNKKDHGIYAHNRTGTQHITDNIIVNGAGYGLHIYANSAVRSIKGFVIEGNAVFNNGSLTLDDQSADQILVGGVEGAAADRIVLRQNFVYSPPEAASSKNRGIRLGYEDQANKRVKLLDNYIVSKIPLRVWWWQSVEARRNTIHGRGPIEVRLPRGVTPSSYQWDFNTFWAGRRDGQRFSLDGTEYNLADWRLATALDQNSELRQSASRRPTGTAVFIRPNKYEAGRAHIVVYNWDHQPAVGVQLDGVLRLGESYELRDGQNYSGVPVAHGIYDGKPIQLPMNLKKVAQPVGNVERVPSHTAAEFGAFVLRRVPAPQLLLGRTTSHSLHTQRP